MKCGLQQVKVAVEERVWGEGVVIEQGRDGRITCVRARGGKVRAAACGVGGRPGQGSASPPAGGR